MTAFVLQVATLLINVLILGLVGFYILRLRKKEKKLDKKEEDTDTNYHKIVDDALNKERKILDDAAREADQIITGAQYVRQNVKEAADDAMQRMIADVKKETENTTSYFMNISRESKETFSKALNDMVGQVQKEVHDMTKNYMGSYDASLKQSINQSISDFKTAVGGLEKELQGQISDFRKNLLDNVEKEMKEYKTARLKEIEKKIPVVVQRVSEEVINSSIPQNDHQRILIESLERAKKEGLFN